MFIILLSLGLAARYGAPGTNTVVADTFDCVEVIGTPLPKPKVKDIKEAHYTDREIAEEEYPWPGHGVDCNGNKTAWWSERDKIWAAFASNAQVTQDTLYRHPVAEKQFYGTKEELDKADRVKVRVMIDCRFGWRHFLGIFAPPGEVITIEIPEGIKNKVCWLWNIHMFNWDYDGSRNRIPDLKNEPWTTLKNTVNTIGWPYGGCLMLSLNPDSVPQPFEVNISGGVLAPWFRYGVDSDEDWEVKKHYPGLVACIETGNIMMLMPSSQVRSSSGLNDACRFFRSCAQVMESTIQKTDNMPFYQRWNGREKVPNYWHIDTYVPAGEACAFVGANFVQMPVYWSGSALSIGSMQGCWGHLHEMGHHHQGGWGIGYTGEVTNNVFCTLCYSYYTTISWDRSESGGGWIGDGWNYVAHPFFIIQRGDLLDQYITLLHAFGRDKMREFMRADNGNWYYDRNVYGRVEAYMLRAAVVFGVDIRDHLKFYGFDVSDASAYNQTSVKELEKMKLEPFYPIANLYATGYEVNDTVFETALPFRVTYGQPHIFNFTQYTRWRDGHGEFSFDKFKKISGSWKKISNEVYEYTPPKDATKIDEWKVTYTEKNTKQKTIFYGKVQVKINGHTWDRYMNIMNGSAFCTVLDAYRQTQGLEANASGAGSGMNIGNYKSEGSYVTVCKGKFIAPSTGTYTFFSAPDDAALFYLSDSTLSYDPDRDSKYLILTDDNGYHGYDDKYPSEEQELTAGETYYFCFVIYNHNGQGGGRMGYKFNGGGTTNVPDSSVVFNDVEEDAYNIGILYPTWEEIRGLDDWYGSKHDPVDRNNWQVTSAPREQSGNDKNILINGDTSSRYITQWDPNHEGADFPHVFAIDFGMSNTFETITLNNITGSGTNGYVMNSSMEITCDTPDNVIYQGMWNSRVPTPIELNKSVTCSSMNITIHDNSYWWSEGRGLGGGSAFAEFTAGKYFDVSKVIPISNTRIEFSKKGWRNVTFGAYWNGLGKYGSEKASLTLKFKSGTKEIVVIGDKWANGTTPNIASVYVDGDKVGEFTNNVTREFSGALSYSPKVYKQILFVARNLNVKKEHKLKITVESGEIGLAGFLAQNPDDNEEAKKKSKAGAIAAGVIVALVVVGVAIGVVIFLWKKGKIHFKLPEIHMPRIGRYKDKEPIRTSIQ